MPRHRPGQHGPKFIIALILVTLAIILVFAAKAPAQTLSNGLVYGMSQSETAEKMEARGWTGPECDSGCVWTRSENGPMFTVLFFGDEGLRRIVAGMGVERWKVSWALLRQPFKRKYGEGKIVARAGGPYGIETGLRRGTATVAAFYRTPRGACVVMAQTPRLVGYVCAKSDELSSSSTLTLAQ